MPKIDIASAPLKTVCAYPSPYDQHCQGRSKIALGALGGLDQFGVNLTRLAPGAASAHQHWHKNEDEFVYVLEGEAVLVEGDAQTILRKGDAATFKAGVETGHMLVNCSDKDAVFLEIGSRADEEISTYTDPDVDMLMIKSKTGWSAYRKNGAPID